MSDLNLPSHDGPLLKHNSTSYFLFPCIFLLICSCDQPPAKTESNNQTSAQKSLKEKKLIDFPSTHQVNKTLTTTNLAKNIETTLGPLLASDLFDKSNLNAARTSLVEFLNNEGKNGIIALIDYVTNLSRPEYSRTIENPKFRLKLFAEVLVELYKDRRLGTMSEIIDAMSQPRESDQFKNKIQGQLVGYLIEDLRKTGDKDLIVRAFTEVCEHPRPQTHTIGDLAAIAAYYMGHEEALDMISGKEEAFGSDAVHQANMSIIQQWMSDDSIACSTWIRDLKEGEKRSQYISLMVQNLALTGFLDEAKTWYRLLPEDGKEAMEALEWIEISKEIPKSAPSEIYQHKSYTP